MTNAGSHGEGGALEALIVALREMCGAEECMECDRLISAARSERDALVEALKRIAHGWVTMDEEEMSGIAQEALLQSSKGEG